MIGRSSTVSMGFYANGSKGDKPFDVMPVTHRFRFTVKRKEGNSWRSVVNLSPLFHAAKQAAIDQGLDPLFNLVSVTIEGATFECKVMAEE